MFRSSCLKLLRHYYFSVAGVVRVGVVAPQEGQGGLVSLLGVWLFCLVLDNNLPLLLFQSFFHQLSV